MFITAPLLEFPNICTVNGKQNTWRKLQYYNKLSNLE